DCLAAEYEELRRHALNGSGRGSGLIVFLRRGMRAWMDQERSFAPHAAAPASTSDPAACLPRPQTAAAVLLLAGMALGARKECVC
ncbi:MAG: hypothetical protein NT154_04250, partial [Verrucomicrobia bacterium]|nr:hypothetical protein [Verrucomicrobiota bacterium]